MPFWNKTPDYKARLEHKMCVAKETPEPVFDLSECNLHDVPSGVFSMCSVFRKEVLLLQSNALQSLRGGGSLCDLSLIQVLNISDNKFSLLPRDIDSLCNLEVLNLENNQLRVIPDSLAKLDKLHSLNISGNKFQSFPMVICKMSGLTSLSMCRNPKIKALPKDMSNLTCLENIDLDVQIIIYPPPEVTSNGAECIIKFLCKESNRTYSIGCIERQPLKVNAPRRHSEASWDDTDQTAIYQQYQRAKEQRQKELIQMEQSLRENDLIHAQLASDASMRRQRLLEDVTQEQEKLDKEMIDLQEKKKIEKEKLLKALSNIEDHSAELLSQLIQLNAKSKNWTNVLERLEQDRIETEEMFSIQQEELEEIRKRDILVAMKDMLETEERQRKYETSRLENTKYFQSRVLEAETKIQDALSDRAIDQQILVDKLLEEEYYQKEAFEALQLMKDQQHQEILYQIMLIEKELTGLTMAELKNQDLKANFEINVLAEKRTALAQLLSDLLEAKEKREDALKKRLIEMEEKRLNEIKDFWLLQYQKLMDRKPPEILDAEETMDTFVRMVLLDAGAVNYIPLFAIKCITWKELRDMSFIDFKRIGVLDNAVCEAIISKCQEYIASEKLIEPSRESPPPEPSAPPIENDVPQPSAPPLSPNTEIKLFCQTECVICLDKSSTAVFIPCGHVCCCWGCSQEVTICPMCRDKIQTKFVLSAS